MSGRALKRARINARDHSRLTFLLRCMSDEELIRLRLMSSDEERPRVAILLLRLDQNEKRFRVADARLRKTKPCPVDAFRDESIFKSGDTSIDVHVADEIEMTP